MLIDFLHDVVLLLFDVKKSLFNLAAKFFLEFNVVLTL